MRHPHRCFFLYFMIDTEYTQQDAYRVVLRSKGPECSGIPYTCSYPANVISRLRDSGPAQDIND